jgi:AraC-like DNA-binding protein
MNLTITSTLLLIGIFQTTFLLHTLSQSILAKHKREELQIFFLLLALSFLDGIFLEEGIYLNFPFLFMLLTPICFLLAPLFYIYVLRNTYPTLELNFSVLKKHSIVPIIMVMLHIPFYLLYDNTEKIAILMGADYQDFYTYFIVELIKVFTVLISIFYHILSYKRITLHQQYIKENFSSVEDYSFKWMQKMILGLLGIVLFCVVNKIFNVSYLNEIPIVLWMLVFNWQVVVHVENNLNIEDEPITAKKSSIDISPNELKLMAFKLEELINEKKLYLNLALKLEDVANEMGVSRQKISEVLNQYMKTTFYDYINTKRVELAKKLLLDEKYDGNLLMLSLDCGFKSRSVFYTAFKKNTDLTPSQYKKMNLVT